MVELQQFYKSLMDNLSDSIYFVNPNRMITFWNKAAEQLTGYSSAEVVGKHCFSNILKHIDQNGNQLCLNGCPLAQTLLDGECREAHVFLHHKQGHRVPVDVSILPIKGPQDEIIGAVEIFNSKGTRHTEFQKIKALTRMAFVDPTTELLNKQYAEMKIGSALQEMTVSNLPFGILFVSLDQFSELNTSYGETAGDQILKTIAKTLSTNVNPDDLVCRWHGSRFVILIPETRKSLLLLLANKLNILIARSETRFNDQTLEITASIGGTVARKNDTIETIIKRADQLVRDNQTNGKSLATIDIDD